MASHLTSGPVPTERFERALAFASDAADGLGHAYVSCSHLLLGLAQEPGGMARAALDAAGVTADALHDRLTAQRADHDRLSGVPLQLTTEVREAINRAAAVALAAKSRVVDADHLLRGMLSDLSSADDLLSELGVTASSVMTHFDRLSRKAPSDHSHHPLHRGYRFSMESGWVLGIALDTARRHQARSISAKHLLAALLEFDSPVKDALKQQFSITRKSFDLPLSSTAQDTGDRRLPLAEEVQIVMGFAIGEAWNRGHLAVTPVHLALGLARYRDSSAHLSLAEHGASQYALIDLFEGLMPPTVRGQVKR